MSDTWLAHDQAKRDEMVAEAKDRFHSYCDDIFSALEDKRISREQAGKLFTLFWETYDWALRDAGRISPVTPAPSLWERVKGWLRRSHSH